VDSRTDFGLAFQLTIVRSQSNHVNEQVMYYGTNPISLFHPGMGQAQQAYPPFHKVAMGSSRAYLEA